MDAYLKRQKLRDELIVPPVMLDTNIFGNLATLMADKWRSSPYNGKRLFNVLVTKVLDTRITLSGQIVFHIQCTADVYIPQVGQVFVGVVESGNIQEHRWVTVSFEKEEMAIFLTPESIAKNGQKVKIQISVCNSLNNLCFGHILTK
jgi:translation elongation factor EF-1alpha